MAEIQEVAIQVDYQSDIYTEASETSMETSQGLIDELEIYMKKMVSELPGEPFTPRFATIFRLPSNIHERNKELCEPNLVAIGPYHHGKERLRTMEEHKWYTLRNFLARNENVGLEVYLQAMRSIEEDARICYSETVNMGSDDFVMMLLLDGCFILEWFFSNHLRKCDVFFNLGWALAFLVSDMFLLENQVPFFVLHKLWIIRTQGVSGRRNSCEDRCPLLRLLCPFLTQTLSFTQFRLPQESCENFYHLLDLGYKGVVPDSKPQLQCEQKKFVAVILQKFCPHVNFLKLKLYSKLGKAASSEQRDFAPMNPHMTIPSVSELHDAGVKFKRKKNPANIFDVTFTNGTMEMPFLQIEAPIIRILWNMVAFEQSCRPWGLQQTLSSYFVLLDTLINTDKDVVILEQSGIFKNLFQNAEEAATYFNQFDKIFRLDYRNHYFKGLFQDVREYSQSTWHRHRTRLMQDYFSNPWAVISVVAASVLLILTFVQTYYTAAK